MYNNKREQFSDAAKFLQQREELTDLDSPIAMKEFVRAIGKLKNNKAPGITEIPAKAFKWLDDENSKQVYFFIVDVWEGKAYYWEGHTGLGVTVPKKGDLSDPKKWRRPERSQKMARNKFDGRLLKIFLMYTQRTPLPPARQAWD